MSAECSNNRPCTCPKTDCKNYGKCCDCVAAHLGYGSPPNCFNKKEEGE